MEQEQKTIEKKEKTAEERAKEGQMNNLLDFIIASTFSRHAKLNEQEYLKEIGFENSGRTEEEAVRIAIMSVLTASMHELLLINQTMKNANDILKELLLKGN